MISLGTPKAFEIRTNSSVITMVQERHVAYIYNRILIYSMRSR